MEMAVGILIVCISDITDPLYLPLRGEDQFVRFLRVLLNVLLMYSKTLSINFSASKQTASPPLGRALKKSPFLRTKTEKCYDL